MPIKILRGDDYRGSAPSAVVSDGVSAHTHIALLNVEPDSPPLPCYVKFYPDKTPSGAEHRGLVNELVGHVIASQIGASVPQAAGLILITPDRLACAPQWASDPNAVLVGWWSQDMAHPSLKAHYRITSNPRNWAPAERDAYHAALNELMESSEIHQTIALDNLIANIDRNIGNLLRRSQGRYVLIDHGLCLTGDGWLPDSLDPAGAYPNVIAEATKPESDQWRFKSATLKAHDSMVSQLNAALDTLSPWLEKAIPDEAQAVDEFIRQRGSPGHFAKQIGLVI